MDRVISKHMSRATPAVSVILLAVLVGGCASVAGPSRDVAPKALTNVTIVMGFTPNVQFAPFYVATRLGYYRAARLNVSFNYATEPDALQVLSNGSVDFVDSGGDEVLTAGASGLHVRYVMTQYSRFPSALFFLKRSGIKKVSDLKGRTIGVPAKYGASYYGLLALLAANHVPASSVHIETIGYTQMAAVGSGQVAAAMGYAPNEPVELRSEGKRVGEFDVYRWSNIAGAGIATSDSLVARRPGLVRAFVQATLRGLRFTINHPSKAFDICKRSVHGLTHDALQRTVLNRAIDFWRPAGVGLGRMDAAVWRLTAQILHRFKVISKPVRATRFYTNRFVR